MGSLWILETCRYCWRLLLSIDCVCRILTLKGDHAEGLQQKVAELNYGVQTTREVRTTPMRQAGNPNPKELDRIVKSARIGVFVAILFGSHKRPQMEEKLSLM